MFGKKVLNTVELENEITAQREQVEADISLYRRRRMLDVDAEIQNYELKRMKEVVELEKTCHKQLAEYEHTFHQTKQDRGIELAKLEAKIEVLKENGDFKDKLIESKDEEIARLVQIIESLTKSKKS